MPSSTQEIGNETSVKVSLHALERLAYKVAPAQRALPLVRLAQQPAPSPDLLDAHIPAPQLKRQPVERALVLRHPQADGATRENGGGRLALTLVPCEHAEAQADLGDGDDNGDGDEDDDDPGDVAHLRVRDGVGEDLGQVEEDAASLVEDLDAWVDLEVLADGDIEGVQGWLRVPEEVGDVEDVGCWEVLAVALTR